MWLYENVEGSEWWGAVKKSKNSKCHGFWKCFLSKTLKKVFKFLSLKNLIFYVRNTKNLNFYVRSSKNFNLWNISSKDSKIKV